MAMAAFEWERGEATPEMLDFYRRHVGLEYECEGWITEASRDAIRHFAEGVGDDNPLYLDPSYAGASPYGGLITPPTFPDVFSNKGFTAEDGFHRGPLPGLFGLWAADRWEFHQPVRLGDTLRSIFRMDSIRERPSAFGGTAYEQVDRNTYYNQAGELVASYVILRFNYEREAARGRGKYDEMQPHRYTDAEIEAIERGYEEERVRRRGAEPLYWEDVTEGVAVPPIIKGPLTLTQLIGFVLGWGSAYCQANRLAHQYGQGNPRAVLINREYNIKGQRRRGALGREPGPPKRLPRRLRLRLHAHRMGGAPPHRLGRRSRAHPPPRSPNTPPQHHRRHPVVPRARHVEGPAQRRFGEPGARRSRALGRQPARRDDDGRLGDGASTAAVFAPLLGEVLARRRVQHQSARRLMPTRIRTKTSPTRNTSAREASLRSRQARRYLENL